MTSTTAVSTDTNGNPIAGTSGTTISNNSATTLSSNEFLDLMMDQLENQDPLNPSSSDPSQYMSELAEMTDVQQETNTASNTSSSATELATSQAVGLIGDTVTYTDQTTGKATTGIVNSVQITSSGASLTVDGVAGIAPSTVSSVTAGSSSNAEATPSPSTSSTTSSSSGSGDSGSSGSGA
jgi:flagellar basal-body rod modification protein FlgD